MKTPEKFKTLLERGVENVIKKENILAKLEAGKKLRVKLGIDPTGSELHIGHAVVLRKMRQFQDAGHQVILLIGDYTARIGDPTGKSETRVMLTEKQIHENMKTYIEQASKVLDIKKLEIRHNSEWFGKMDMGDVLALTAKKTVSQMLQREDFKNRFKKEQDISITELLYPLMQGYDSVELQCDIELGGTDQLFNMLVGRDMQRAHDSKVLQDVITVPILEGLDGIEKMSKSLNNYIGIMEPAREIYGKTMSISDNMIFKYFELATDVPMDKIDEMKKEIEQGANPRDLKMRLARELVTLYHDSKAASQAQSEFIAVFAKKEIPDDISLQKLSGPKWAIIELLAATNLCSSKSDARRLIEGGGVRVNQEKVSTIEQEFDISKETLLQVGKRKFLRVIGK